MQFGTALFQEAFRGSMIPATYSKSVAPSYRLLQLRPGQRDITGRWLPQGWRGERDRRPRARPREHQASPHRCAGRTEEGTEDLGGSGDEGVTDVRVSNLEVALQRMGVTAVKALRVVSSFGQPVLTSSSSSCRAYRLYPPRPESCACKA